MEKNADRKLMYLGDSSLWILPVEGGAVDTGGHKPHNEIYGGNRRSTSPTRGPCLSTSC